MLTLPSCSFAHECTQVLAAVAADRRQHRPSPFLAHEAAERQIYEDGGGR
jgi:hypothetical protein